MPLDDSFLDMAVPDLTQFHRVRELSESLAAPLSPEDWMLQSMTEASPVKWHLAHTSWFFETFILEKYIRDYKRYNEDFNYLFNSYYVRIGDMHPRASRNLISRPSAAQVLEYRHHVTSQIMQLCAQLDDKEAVEVAQLLRLGCAHEEQHQELLLTDIKHALFQNPTGPSAYTCPALPDRVSWDNDAWVEFDGGVVDIGADGGEGFNFDNEAPHHQVLLKPFALASAPVTNRQYCAFIEAGGYQDPRWWLSDGWEKVVSQNWRAPLYWCGEGRDRTRYGLFGIEPLNPGAPVSHLSFYEAAAYAEWAGCRLPTEFEWEYASGKAAGQGTQLTQSGPFEPQPAVFERDDMCHQMFGDVWEWTASPYTAYPGFRASPGAIGEYNGKFMSSQMVLRGGSCATPAGHVRGTYRNFFPPAARWQFAGVRLARHL